MWGGRSYQGCQSVPSFRLNILDNPLPSGWSPSPATSSPPQEHCAAALSGVTPPHFGLPLSALTLSYRSYEKLLVEFFLIVCLSVWEVGHTSLWKCFWRKLNWSWTVYVLHLKLSQLQFYFSSTLFLPGGKNTHSIFATGKKIMWKVVVKYVLLALTHLKEKMLLFTFNRHVLSAHLVADTAMESRIWED